MALGMNGMADFWWLAALNPPLFLIESLACSSRRDNQEQ
jgi:hypothetical protein